MSGLRILLADDETDFIQSLAKVLRRRGLVVETASDGVEALEHLTQTEFDVVVLDLRMPRMGGLETLHAFRRRDDATPVLILSGHADLEATRRALTEGASDVILKPCPVDTLLSAITDAAERKALIRDAAPPGHSPPEGTRP